MTYISIYMCVCIYEAYTHVCTYILTVKQYYLIQIWSYIYAAAQFMQLSMDQLGSGMPNLAKPIGLPMGPWP